MEYFVALAEEQQFTRAAELTRVSQSGLSASIRTLEDELQTPLFVRTTRRVELTEAGLALLPHARAMLAQATAGKDAVVATRAELTGQVNIGGEQCLGIDVPELLARFNSRYPKVRVSYEQAGTLALLSAMRAGELDIAFIAGSDAPPRAKESGARAIERRTLATEPLVLLCSPQSPVARKSRVTLAEIEGEAFVDFHESWAIRAINDEAFGAASLLRTVRFTVNEVHTLLDLVHRQLGIAVVPRPIASKPQAQGLVKIPLAGDRIPNWVLGVAVPARDATGGVTEHLLDMLPTDGPVAGTGAGPTPLPAVVG